MNIRSGVQVAILRQSIGLSQERMAEFVGVNQSTVSRWEAGLTSPSQQQWSRILELSGARNNSHDLKLGFLASRCPGPASLCTLDFRIIEASHALSEVMNIERSKLIGMNARNLFTDDLEHAYQKVCHRGILDKDILGVELSGSVKLFNGETVGHQSSWTVTYLSDKTPIILWQGIVTTRNPVDQQASVKIVSRSDYVIHVPRKT
ncbi:helix-turn-helix domain-containing protein [Caenispirillum salinarum]|uniref:helix-turn-helix domain-containing protein n=1 Tax=Caenispirillum salinarum TaxID=859058 RepID=UPI0005BD798C|nr:helix-turn-helix transcriptional regulator [Caenispirillum salinarum]